jgi:diguanylate cyclase (GGDEF)-like protein
VKKRGTPLDLFEKEQKIFDDATKLIEEAQEGGSLGMEEYKTLLKEYGKLLKQLRKSVHFADRISNGLFKSNLILDEKVHYDALTGIYNRRFMDDNLKRGIKSLSRTNGILSIMMLDIDFFKKYNDAYGHKAGDTCLKTVAITLSETARMDDCVIRYGGEEFVILLPNTDETGVGTTAVRLLQSIRSLGIPHKDSDIADHVTISIGATTIKVKLQHEYMDYIQRADEALYMSKNTGRDKYTFLKYIDPEDNEKKDEPFN